MGEWAIEITFPFEGVPKGRPRLGRGNRVFTPRKTAQFEHILRLYTFASGILKKEIPPFGTHLKVELEFHFLKKKTSKLKRPVPDCDNLIKSCQDSLNGIFWKDDADIVSVKATKQFSPSGKIVLRVGYA